MTAFERLLNWRNDLANKAKDRGEMMFLDKPDTWYDDPHFMCENGHVSGNVLTGDWGDRCLACLTPVVLGPMIKESDFLPIAQRFQEKS